MMLFGIGVAVGVAATCICWHYSFLRAIKGTVAEGEHELARLRNYIRPKQS